MADPLAATFRRPFPEQVAAFRLRLGDLVPTARWDDLWQDAHDRGFMVAGATKADLLADLAAAVDKAIFQGTSLEEFRADFRGIVEKHGWHGWTGEDTEAGRAWRTRLIYRTNARTTYAAGRHAQLVEGGFKYWVYRHGGSLEPRIQHLGWDGLILEADHPFWKTHYPPNGWGCSCYVIGARSIEGAKRRGGDPDVEPGDWQKIDPKTGAPEGIDKGWAYAPGRSVSKPVLELRDKLEILPERPSIDLIQKWLEMSAFGRWLADPHGYWPLVRISEADAQLIGSKRKIAVLSEQSALKQLSEHPELSPRDYVLAQNTVDNATHKIRDRERDLVFVRDTDDGHLVVVKTTASGEGLFVTSLRRMSKDQAMRDRLIRRILRRRS